MLRIPGMAILAERLHNKHDSSVFIRDGLKVNNNTVKKGMLSSLQWSYLLVLLYNRCINHHLNHSDSLHRDKNTLTS